jgi:Uma2 family endonuclease
MSSPTITLTTPVLIYPESDGQPMADNTRQFECIVTIKGGLDAEFRDDPDVFVAGDLLWYPVEGSPTIRTAPDVLVVFGRPKGHRGSYRQWEEGGLAPHVVFEVMSPGNRFGEMLRKFQFYQHHGVEEYYLYDPDRGTLDGWRRVGEDLLEIPSMLGWTSPRLQVRFELVDGELQLYGRDGRRFATYVELVDQREKAQRQRDHERQEKQDAQQRVERLAAQLRALGAEPQA